MDGRPPTVQRILRSQFSGPATWMVPKRPKTTVKPLITYGLKPGRIRYKTNSGYRLNMLVQDFTACGLGGTHGPRVDGIPNTERRVGQSPGYKLEAHSGLSLQCFSWNTFSCGNKAVSGGLVLPPTVCLTLAEMGLHINGGFLLFLWKNAALVVT